MYLEVNQKEVVRHFIVISTSYFFRMVNMGYILLDEILHKMVQAVKKILVFLKKFVITDFFFLYDEEKK